MRISNSIKPILFYNKLKSKHLLSRIKMGTNTIRAFIILYLLAVCGCVEYDVDNNVQICTCANVSHINHTLWYYNNKVIALATEDRTSGYISSFIKRVNISLTCLNISSLRYEDSGSYKGVSHLKDGVIITTTMNISVKANIIDLTGRVCYLTRNYCEVKIRCEIKSFALNGSITPLHMILGTLDRWKYLPFPTDDYRYVGELKRYISGNPYPIESLALEISATFNRFTIVKNNDDEFSCYLFSQNYSFHKMLNARHICESEWEALNNNNDNSSSMPASHNNRANDLSSMMSQLQNDNDDNNDYSAPMNINNLIMIVLITMLSIIIIIIVVIAIIAMYKRSKYSHIDDN
ncbi:36.5kDa major membrane precursor protein [Variola virus]|uniref:Protein OPG049 n=1 Tax=Variola virus TaxID=10255 RepID=Q0NF57_VARV|nr:36.5kDa major membrane precursor protein [Variola virus]ABF25403.1 36.5kDa major membrane precursor protein [Variola virus]ABF25605.1 36.5kDa major membrane precursor protein [Variola virus]ABF25806.1 36.5kDa major membrane precursor protein [Variola virus]